MGTGLPQGATAPERQASSHLVSIETFTTLVVPGIASAAYFAAGVANIYAGHYPLAVMWLCYSCANIALLISISHK